MSSPSTRLRLRFAVLGAISVLTPLLVLLAVAAWTTEEVRTAADGTTVVETEGLSAWIPVTVALLVIPAAAAAWWWAGREVALQGRATRAVQDQRRLIEDASHQLRTPIAVLMANADVTLADANPTMDDVRAALQTSRDTGAAMQRVVEGLLTDARARRVEAGRDTTDVVAIAARACGAHASQSDTKGVAVRRTGPGHLVAAVDPLALERAIDALVDNAIRHSPPGAEVVVAITSDDDAIRISVTDQGPGIVAAHHADVFRRYWTTDADRNGIGLAVVAEASRDAFIVDFTSPLGEHGGTTFELRLPPS